MDARIPFLSGLLALPVVGCGGGGSAPPPPPVPSVTVLAPNGGESWTAGTSATITWSSSAFTGTLDLELSADGGATWTTLVASTPDDGTEFVTVPAVASTSVRVQVSAADGDPAVALAPSDLSDAVFAIVPPPSLTILSPNGGEDWLIGATATVTWDPDSYLGNVDLELSVDGGTTWAALASDTPNDGTESVIVPVAPTPTARVQVSAADGLPAVASAPADTSDAVFHVGGPPVDIGAGLPGVSGCSLAWGDYDADGDLDLAMAGYAGSRLSRIYRNDGGTYTDIGAGLQGVGACALAWGDYDADGDLDLLVAGTPGFGGMTRIYRNDAGTFTDIGAGVIGVGDGCAVAWGDYDNDGDLDLALAGWTGSARVTRIYRNALGTFTDITAGLPGVSACSLAWGDYDNDGDLDLALVGTTGSVPGISRIYRNDGGTFQDVAAGLVRLLDASVAWGDYDGDGDLDLALAGNAGATGSTSRVYRNDGGTFTDIAADLEGVTDGSLAWGDYDGDGDLDLAIAGAGAASAPVSRIYRNDGEAFTDVHAGLSGVSRCTLAWGDYDQDGDLDLALAGYTGTESITRIYRNDGGFAANTPPSAPMEVLALTGGGEVLINWLPADDLETPEDGLSYNLRICTAAGTCVFPSMADEGGLRRIPARGPIVPNPFFVSAWLKLPPGEYAVSVQAVDTGFVGGTWSEPVPFVIP